MPSSRPCCTVLPSTPRWSPSARRTATGAARSASTEGSPRPCRITACSTRPSRRQPSSGQRSGTRWKEAAPSPSSCTPTSSAAQATRSSTSCRSCKEFISEAAIVGAAVGYAMEGGRAVAELMYADFIGRAGDEIFNQLSKWQAMSAGVLSMPVVLRISVGDKYGAQHSQDWTALLHHIPGLKVVYPVTPYDAKGMMNSALIGTDPVVFLESQKLYDVGELFEPGGVPEGYYEIELSEPSVKRPGSDLTILTLGPALYTAIKAAEELSASFGISAEVIDLRSAVPIDYRSEERRVGKEGRSRWWPHH